VCGIFGWVLPDQSRRDRDLLARLTDLQFHRGPDGGGYWLNETADGRHQIGLGSRRLSIIDIPGGSQPMWSSDGKIGMVYNGEIYNYVELRAELKAKGRIFSTQSDTEVVVEAYRVWGPDAVRRFRGMFAFALWDTEKQILLLARDPFGKKPLFLHEQNGKILFSSEVESILGFPGVPRALNAAALPSFMLHRYVPGPETLFEGIEKLPPGYYALWQNGTLTKTRYYTPPLASATPDIASFEEAVSELDRVLDDAVRIRMRSDAPFGAYLSGGIDSSAIVSMMVRHAGGTVRTFTAGFREKALSELDYAREVADVFSTEHHELLVEPDAFFAAWPDAVRHRGAPVSEMADVVIMLLSRMARSNVKMVLTGEGSDEVFGGYPKYRGEAWVERYQRVMPEALHRFIFAPLVHALPFGFQRAKVVATAAGEREFDKRMAVWFSGMTSEDSARLAKSDAASGSPGAATDALKFASPLRRMLYFDQMTWLPDNLLERGDRMMMAGSIEGRMPFMDTEVAALGARMPDPFLTGGSGGKRVLRAALKSRLPDRILNRRKIGFQVPVGAWFRGKQKPLLLDLLMSGASRTAAICDEARLSALVHDHLDGRQDNARTLWALANLEMFLREFGLNADAVPETFQDDNVIKFARA
jgi:asparagine synthase (glutamine-hydrolysing)